jgi:hypothetical protein
MLQAHGEGNFLRFEAEPTERQVNIKEAFITDMRVRNKSFIARLLESGKMLPHAAFASFDTAPSALLPRSSDSAG